MAMHPIVGALLKDFATTQSLANLTEAEQFEHFVNYAIISDIYSGDFNPVDISTGTVEFGLDGIAIVANGALIEDIDEVDELSDINKYLDVEFVFTQAKTASHFESGDILKTLSAVEDFFSHLRLIQGEKVKARFDLVNHIYSKSNLFRKNIPKLSIYYVALGSWQHDANIVTILDVYRKKFEAMALFSEIHIHIVDVPHLRQLYTRTQNSYRKEVTIDQNIPLPSINNVQDAIIGLMPALEYLKLVTDDYGGIRKKLFFDNMRDFLEGSATNLEIAETIGSDRSAEFPLRNNGITIVARKITRSRNKFDLEDYQIVNGCQTSHVLFNNRDRLTSDIVVQVKVIVTEDDEVTNKIIRGSNVSNDFDKTQLWATEPFHKDVEIYFEKRFDGDSKLYYERRKGQFNSDLKLEKPRIISPQVLLKSFVSMFLDRPHDVTKYYSLLLPEVGRNIFNGHHDLFCYYLSAYASYRIETLFRTRRLPSEYKACRHHLLMGLKYAFVRDAVDLRNRSNEKRLECLTEVLYDPAASADIFNKLIEKTAIIASDHNIDLPRQLAKTVTLRDELRKVAPDILSGK